MFQSMLGAPHHGPLLPPKLHNLAGAPRPQTIEPQVLSGAGAQAAFLYVVPKSVNAPVESTNVPAKSPARKPGSKGAPFNVEARERRGRTKGGVALDP